MMIKTISITAFSVALGSSFSAQTAIFKYDEAGNQIFRGLCDGCKKISEKSSVAEEAKAQTIAQQVAHNIKVAPVPVKANLNILWDAKVKDYIRRIELVPYNDVQILNFFDMKTTSISCVFNMESYSYGVYYLKFYLSDGSIYTRTITKN